MLSIEERITALEKIVTGLNNQQQIITHEQGAARKDRDEIRAEYQAIKKSIAVPPPQGLEVMTNEEFEKCKRNFKRTLFAMGQEREIFKYEERQIMDLARIYGPHATAYALIGIRFEESTPTYNPKKHVSLPRAIESEKIFSTWVSLGSAEETRRKKKGVA